MEVEQGPPRTATPSTASGGRLTDQHTDLSRMLHLDGRLHSNWHKGEVAKAEDLWYHDTHGFLKPRLSVDLYRDGSGIPSDLHLAELADVVKVACSRAWHS